MSEERGPPPPPLFSSNQPFLLKWGNQRHVRCVKFPGSSFNNNDHDHHHHHHNNTNTSSRSGFYGDRNHRRRHGVGAGGTVMTHQSSSSSSASGVRVHDFRQEFKIPRRKVAVSAAPAGQVLVEEEEEEEGIDAVREKLVFDLKMEADKMKHAIFNNGVADDEEADERFPLGRRAVVVGVAETEKAAATDSVEPGVARPWNLRTRRSTGKVLSAAQVSDAPPAVNEFVRPSRGRGEREVGVEKRAKFSVGLKRKEIEDDFRAMVGHRPARRPKKRPRNVQKVLDVSFIDG